MLPQKILGLDPGETKHFGELEECERLVAISVQS